jgi:dTDP-4-dehydrorhamnose reductase
VEAPERTAAPGKPGFLDQAMKILVTGYPGLLSLDLVPILRTDHEVVTLSIEELDITIKEETFKTLETLQPDVVINCAGYTAVDQAETDWEGTFRVNALGVHHLALACRHLDTVLCQISTDYVFDGLAQRPYQPWDHPNPISVYGSSKRAGEFFAASLLNRYYIIRTSSLYGKHGNNFVQAILNKAENGDPLSVVADQVMSPTWTVNLSRGIAQVIHSQNFGIYHLTDQTGEGINWYDFSLGILARRGLTNTVRPIASKALNRPASRPAYSVLDTRYTTMATGYRPLSWQEALEQFLANR